MLTRFRANNFRSLLNVDFRPSGLNLLVGPNNAGKTNLCMALRFLGRTSESTLDAALVAAIGERWNVTNLHVNNVRNLEFEVECDITFRGETLHFNYELRLESRRDEKAGTELLEVSEEFLKASGGRFADTPLLENRAGRVRMLHEEGFAAGHPDSPYYVQATAATNVTMLSRLFELENNPRAILFRRYLQSWGYYSLNPEMLRSPDVARDDGTLLSSGANLSRALFDLHNQKPRLERKLIEAVRKLEPKLELFSFSAPDPEHVHLFGEDEKAHRFSTRSMSDGTLRFTAIAYVILIAGQQAASDGFAPLIIIEEPENGLYVAHLKPLLQRVEPDGKLGQFIFTTHSPYFVDLFDKFLDGVHVIKAGTPSSVLSKPEPAKLKHLLDDMSLGDIHFHEMLS
ncbi:MAG: AAA family ATPase [Limisphaerales bacterium]